MKVWFPMVLVFSMMSYITQGQNKVTKSYEEAKKAPNKTDESGQKQGEWFFSYNIVWQTTNQEQDVVFYRLARYKNGKIQGKLRDYYKNGQVQMVMDSVISEKPRKYHGKGLYYHKNGKLHKEVVYNNGERLSYKCYNLNKKVAKNPWDKLFDEGYQQLNVGNYNEALRLFEKAEKQAKKEFVPATYAHIQTYKALGRACMHLKRFEDAEKYFLHSESLITKTFGEFSNLHIVAVAYLAKNYNAQGAFNKSEEIFQQLLKRVEKKRGKNSLYYARVLQSLGFNYLSQRNYVDAEPMHKQALQILEKIDSVRYPAYAEGLGELGKVYAQQKMYDKAEAKYKKAWEIVNTHHKKKLAKYAHLLIELGVISEMRGGTIEAEKWYLKAKKLVEAEYGKKHIRYLDVLSQLVVNYVTREMFDEAQEVAENALKIIKESFRLPNPQYNSFMRYLSFLQVEKAIRKKDRGLMDKVIKRAKKVHKNNSVFYVQILSKASFFYAKLGDKKTAIKHLKTALLIVEEKEGKYNNLYQMMERRIKELEN